jgi:hypothetical protein
MRTKFILSAAPALLWSRAVLAADSGLKLMLIE